MVTEEDLAVGRLYPPLSDIHRVSLEIARVIAEDAYSNGEYNKIVLMLSIVGLAQVRLQTGFITNVFKLTFPELLTGDSKNMQ